MREDVIAQGSTIEEALENGLKDMKTTIDEVDYEIIEEGLKVLNVVIKPYRIRIARTKIKSCQNKIEHNSEENGEETIDAQLNLEVDKSKIRAYLTITPPRGGGKMIDKLDILNALNENGIVYGIKHETIDQMISNHCFNEKTLIAEGNLPVDGEDGKIIYYFDINFKAKPKLLENGNVDFKELSIIKNVSKGDILAEKILATNGTDGKTITGNIIKAKPGKTVYFKKGKHVIESDDGNYLISNEFGYPKVVDDKVCVFQVYEINGNVDNSTGNICFHGNIIIKGNVYSGFKIEAQGDVEVFGVVEGAIINAEGNIILHKGIQGHNSGKLYSKKNITALYMENCYAKALGSIYADVVMHCVLESKESILVSGKKGMIIGGEAKANNEISAKSIGSTMATQTKIEVGIDPEMKQRYESLKQELDVLYTSRENIIKAIDLLAKLSKTVDLSDEKRKTLDKSIKTKEYLEEKIGQVNSMLLNLNETLQSLSNGKLHVYNSIFPGVKITIGSSVLYVREMIKHATIIREEGEIKTTSYLGN